MGCWLDDLLDQRLRFDDGVLVRERVKGRNKKTMRARFDHDITERGHRQAMIWLKVVQDAALVAVGENLVVDLQVDLFGQCFDLKAGLVKNIVAASEASRMFAAQAIAQESALIGKSLIDVRDFGQKDVLVLPGDDIA